MKNILKKHLELGRVNTFYLPVLHIPMRASVFCLKLSLGAVSVVGAVLGSESQGSGELAVGMDLAMAKKS